MTLVFYNEIILTNISDYLTLHDLLSFSSINKTLYYQKLNPEYNSVINTLYRKLVLKKIYFSQLLGEIKAQKKEDILDDYKITGNNWKLIYIELARNYHMYNTRDIVIKIYECFQNHLYLPFIRKSNKLLEKKRKFFTSKLLL